jgi:carbohydrate-selective porin OprB
LTYFQIQRGFSIQPDIQYIIRSGGFDQANNALVLGLQIAVEL